MKKAKSKTRKTVARRFHETATGKIMREKTGAKKATRKKAPNRQRNLLRHDQLDKGDLKRISRMLGTK